MWNGLHFFFSLSVASLLLYFSNPPCLHPFHSNPLSPTFSFTDVHHFLSFIVPFLPPLIHYGPKRAGTTKTHKHLRRWCRDGIPVSTILQKVYNARKKCWENTGELIIPKTEVAFFFYLYIDTLETVSVVLMTVVIVVVLTIAEVVVAEVVVGLLTVFQVLY